MNTRRLGAGYEAVAAEYLAGRGYTILERNYRIRGGEIDLIAEKDRMLVYIEVKFRSSSCFGDPLEAVDRRKQKRLGRAAAFHYARYGAGEGKAVRFDVIGIYGDGSVRHVENAFDYQG
ncbi:MAG: YraN family protein [Lachnospiraceae bacterium]|nr:YraN family protein [Lachnospiraceae bacterium]